MELCDTIHMHDTMHIPPNYHLVETIGFMPEIVQSLLLHPYNERSGTTDVRLAQKPHSTEYDT